MKGLNYTTISLIFKSYGADNIRQFLIIALTSVIFKFVYEAYVIGLGHRLPAKFFFYYPVK